MSVPREIVSATLVLTGFWGFAGCAPGSLSWWDGEAPLRTALYKADAQGVRVLLSTSVFDCALPTLDDPAAVELALLTLGTAACREDARHIGLSITPQGTLQSAWYYAVDEAVLQTREGIVQTYLATEVQEGRELTGTVSVRALRDDRLRGSFELPEVSVSGRFVADRCGDAGEVFDLIAASPSALCP